ncbi:MAG: hypothetical protein HOH19_05480 [Kordiimonadaceae bacterium]|jgi:hypothetical protein|nr:hypothetical protein [Kordiimonadaceae bacterium]MBT6032006.1 hypothetical protein [Kordiimonadaceae bacterium]
MIKNLSVVAGLALLLSACSEQSSAPEMAESTAETYTYTEVEGWLTPPPGQATLGDQHGDIEVDKAGNVYVSVMGEPKGVQIYSADGKYIGNVKDAPNTYHDFIIHEDSNGIEYIYGAELDGQYINKTTLDGEMLLRIDALATIPAQYQKDGVAGLSLTGTAVAANGDIYVVDGYGMDYIHRYDSMGNYITSFAGKGEPYNFNTCHKIIMDTRFSPEQLVCADRENGRVIHMDLEGKILNINDGGYRRPSALAINGDHLGVAELHGRVIVLDKAGETVVILGTNEDDTQRSTNQTGPELWENGLVTSPHGIAYDADGNILVSEWNAWGRVHFYKKD